MHLSEGFGVAHNCKSYPVTDVIGGEHNAGVSHKVVEELIFLGREVDLLAVESHMMTKVIKRKLRDRSPRSPASACHSGYIWCTGAVKKRLPM